MRPTIAVMAIARNEGPFLLEWIAHHLGIGVDHIVIATNDCEDGSDHLLDLVAQHQPVTHIDNSADLDDLTIQARGNIRCLAHPAVAAADWVLHIDLDEFLNLTGPDKTVGAFARHFESADAVAIQWRLFGDNGRRHWDGGLVTDAFFACEAAPSENPTHKTLFRPGIFGRMTPHMPKEPRKPADTLRVVNTRGEAMPTDRMYQPRGTTYGVGAALASWDRAVINHYMTKSTDLSRLKLARGDANNRAVDKRRPGHPAHAACNLNTVTDHSIQDSRAPRIARLNALMDVPEIAEAHRACLRWMFATQRALSG